MPALTKPAIDSNDTENLERELLNQWLRSFFTGAPHLAADGATMLTYPLCTIAFAQTDVRSLDNPLIHWDVVTRATTRMPGEDGMVTKTDCLSNVYVQVNTQGRMDEADHTCAGVAANLHELLGSACFTSLLAAKGISRVRPMRGPTPLIIPGLRSRLLVVRHHLEYAIATAFA